MILYSPTTVSLPLSPFIGGTAVFSITYSFPVSSSTKYAFVPKCGAGFRTKYQISADTTIQPVRFMVDSGEGRDHDSPERILQRRGAAEFIGMVFHGYSITHVDTPAHYFWQGKMYNGRSANLVTSREGAQAGFGSRIPFGIKLYFPML